MLENNNYSNDQHGSVCLGNKHECLDNKEGCLNKEEKCLDNKEGCLNKEEK